MVGRVAFRSFSFLQIITSHRLYGGTSGLPIRMCLQQGRSELDPISLGQPGSVVARGTGASPGWWTGFFLRSIDGIVCLLAHGPVTTVICVPTSLYCDIVLRQLNVEGCESPRRGLGKCCCGNTAMWGQSGTLCSSERLSLRFPEY